MFLPFKAPLNPYAVMYGGIDHRPRASIKSAGFDAYTSRSMYMMEYHSYRHIINDLLNKGKEKGYLTYNELQVVLSYNMSIEQSEGLFSILEGSGINVVHDTEATLKSSTPSEECLTAEEEIELSNIIKACEKKLKKYKQQLESIEENDEKNNTKLLIFLEEERIKGAQERLTNAYLPLLISIEKEYSQPIHSSLDKHDFIQEGYLGLLIAARKYKFKSGDTFSNFASKLIRDTIEKAIKYEVLVSAGSEFENDHLESQDQEECQEIRKDLKDTTNIIEYPMDTNKGFEGSNTATPNNFRPIMDNAIVPALNIPHLIEVKPVVTKEEQSLLSSKKRMQASKYGSILDDIAKDHPSSAYQVFKPIESIQTVPNMRLPKSYSRLRFDSGRRLSLYARAVGERAEEIVIKFLYETLLEEEKHTIKWISKRGETPGWDIEYIDSTNKLVAIEVKGTNGNSFPNIEITGNEWIAAQDLRNSYWIYLVTKCLSTDPQIQRIENPYQLKESGTIEVSALLWRIELISE